MIVIISLIDCIMILAFCLSHVGSSLKIKKSAEKKTKLVSSVRSNCCAISAQKVTEQGQQNVKNHSQMMHISHMLWACTRI